MVWPPPPPGPLLVGARVHRLRKMLGCRATRVLGFGFKVSGFGKFRVREV